MKFIQRLDNYLAGVEKAVIVLLFSALIFLTVFHVLLRNVFDLSFQRILEFTPAMVLWLALVGSSLAIKDNRHIKIEVLLRFISPKAGWMANKITAVFGMMVMGVLFYASLVFVMNEISIFGFKGLVTVIFPLFFFISFFRFFIKLIDSNTSGRSYSLQQDIL